MKRFEFKNNRELRFNLTEQWSFSIMLVNPKQPHYFSLPVIGFGAWYNPEEEDDDIASYSITILCLSFCLTKWKEKINK